MAGGPPAGSTDRESISVALLEFALSLLALALSVGAFFLTGALTGFWDLDVAVGVLAVLSALLYLWRRRGHFAGSAALLLAGALLGLALGGGPELQGIELSAILTALGLALLFWPLLAP